MGCSLSSQKHIFRFRRWSRKNYAVFASLGRAVTIGSLSVHMAAKTLFHAVVKIVGAFIFIQEEHQDPDWEVLVSPELVLLASVVKTESSVAGVAAERNIFLFINHRRLRQLLLF